MKKLLFYTKYLKWVLNLNLSQKVAEYWKVVELARARADSGRFWRSDHNQQYVRPNRLMSDNSRLMPITKNWYNPFLKGINKGKVTVALLAQCLQLSAN